ncbi:Adenylate and Guanylate cyclase catalytic domain containing protein [Tritrichomonas foetus]|uniref:Adenylate and Guanylate cyclase catalytic domain containing protein n=1 Tax=Tritrichomonas foetus TaxID=1144522 RepID=A0A1J4JBA0_9EUKA|nr:Adenylate and Guanylate cyclase catalytic domain containing protein [Tritrichomonas foetus]|eukprot:OHS95519.1 Adenylate and Guanylate cyclase catalytic domain containing protein [Tritrichomonas foetus]
MAIANLLDSSVTSSHSRSIVFEPADLADDGIYASIRSAITSIKFPVIRMTNIMILFYFLLAIVIAAPVTLLVVAIQLFTTTELVMISAYTSTVSVNSAHMAIVATRDFFRRVNGFENSSEYVHENGYPDSLGNSSDPSIQMSFMINKVDDLLIKMKKVYDYSADDIPSLYTFTQIIFEPTNTFYSYQVIDYPDNVTKTVTMKSIDAAMTYMGILGNQIISTKKEEHDNLIKSYEFPTLFNHAERTYTGLISACDAMSTYYNDSISQILDALMFLVPLYICILLVLCIVFIVIINKKIQETKWSVMHSFLTVPKQAISQIVQSMKIHGQDEDSEEDEDEDVEVIRNKHEDNMLAILSSFVDKPEGNAMFMISSGIVILFLFGLASLLFIYLYIKEPGNSLIITAAQTRNIGFSYTSSILTYLELLRIASAQYGHKFPGDNMATSLNMTNELISSSRKFLRNAKIGQKDPFYVSPISQIDSHAYNILFDNQNTNCTPHSMNQFDNLIKCRATDTDYMILDYYIEQVVSELTNVDRESGDISKSRAYDLLEKIWYVGSNYIYDQAIAPELDNLPIVAFDNFNGKIQIMILCIALVIIATLFLALFLLVEVQKINKHLKWMVEMMMHLPPDTLLSSKAIVSVLSGHFSEKERKSANLSDAFYNSVIEKFLDAVFFTDLNLCITKVNPAAERIFSTNPIGKDFLSLNFMHNKNYDSLKNMINGIINKTGKVQSSQNVKMISADGAKLYLNVSITPINGNGVIKTINADTQIENLIFVIRDITQNRRSDKLLKEEKMRSDSLLRHILPPVIVDGLQQGEKDISFSVPSASVLFMDIVEFTPWCASLQAAQVMSTLNMLFKEFDIALAQYSTLTKIKCIGDCYMCAGGIFETNNQPKIHAHETVSFGIDSIKAVLKVNSEINQNLRIRVGVNTGGPLVAGVLGIDRPTFEILGPAINMAQQMEHHGIPMMVHISPTVYELIFGGNLNIKERGEVEVKSGVMTTYLVTPE